MYGEPWKRIDELDPMGGIRSIADLVTDQAEEFPTDGPEATSYESLPLDEELEIRTEREIAGRIEEILEREKPERWGYAADAEINEAVLEFLLPEFREHLARNIVADLSAAPEDEVRKAFSEG